MEPTNQPTKRVIDWEAIEREYRAGIRSLRDIADQFGVTEGAIRKRARRDGWERDLSGKIAAQAEALVRKDAVRESVRADERAIIESNAELQATAILSHRSDIRRNRDLLSRLLAELTAQTGDPAMFDRLGELLRDPDANGMDKLNEIYKKSISLPARIKGMKDLVDTLRVLIALEREAFGIKDAPDEDRRRRDGAAMSPAEAWEELLQASAR